MKEKSKSEQFCHDILNMNVNRYRPLANAVMALASATEAQSVVQLSKSEIFHYHYSNLTKIMTDISFDEQSYESLIQEVNLVISRYIPPIRKEEGTEFYGFTTDTTKIIKAHSPTLEGRTYVPIANNAIKGNKPVGIGYPVSCLHLNPFEQGQGGWCPPMTVERLTATRNAIEAGAKALMSVMTDKTLPFGDSLCLHKADTSYGQAAFLSPTHEAANLVNIVRLRASSKIYQSESDTQTGGAPKIYGQKWYLIPETDTKTYFKKGVAYTVERDSIMDLPCSEHISLELELSNGRKVVVELFRWNDLKIRSKNGNSMKDKPLDIIRCVVKDAETKELVFVRPLFIALCGKRKSETSTTLAYFQYCERYDVEPFYRFAKQSMLLDSFQTSDVGHLDNWLAVWTLAVWLLLTASSETQAQPEVWEKYLSVYKEKTVENEITDVLTIAQTRKAAHTLFSTFDPNPFLPQKYKKGKGRQKGDTLTPKPKFDVVKKEKKIPICKLKCQKNE
ncbi:hypothetical protein [Flavobacterium sp.]|uniref:hypothetical protein n=1 Tax=Flavobacterium sp. TaxID=239 RepID=UPI00374DF34E